MDNNKYILELCQIVDRFVNEFCDTMMPIDVDYLEGVIPRIKKYIKEEKDERFSDSIN